MRLAAGTYYGQWMSGLRHGFGVRQSAPFSVATPVRHDDLTLQQLSVARQRKLRHRNSMPVLGSSFPAYDLSPAANATLPDRGRSGFVLTGDGDAGRRGPRRRPASAERSISDSVGSINLVGRRPDGRADDANSQVRFVLSLIMVALCNRADHYIFAL